MFTTFTSRLTFLYLNFHVKGSKQYPFLESSRLYFSLFSFGNDTSLPAPSFKLNKTEVYADIEEQNLTAVLNDIKSLEKELDQGNTYLKQSEELRMMIKEVFNK